MFILGIKLAQIYAVPKAAPAATEEPFFVKYTWQQSSGPDTPELWYVRGNSVHVVYLALLVTFTNLQSTPLLIDSYVIEQQADDGTWQSASITLVDDQGTFYWGPDPTSVKESKYTTFDSVIANKNIAPHESVRGWVFFSRFFVDRTFHHAGFRFRISDSLGNSYSEPLVGNIGNPVGWMIQPMMTSDSGKPPRDISALITPKK